MSEKYEHTHDLSPLSAKSISPLSSLYLVIPLFSCYLDFYITYPVTTITIPTPVHPTTTCLHHFRAIRTIPKLPLPIPNPLAPSQASSHLSNALLNPPTLLRLINVFPTCCSFDLLFFFYVKSIPDDSLLLQLWSG